jgi:hypothetical protein
MTIDWLRRGDEGGERITKLGSESFRAESSAAILIGIAIISAGDRPMSSGVSDGRGTSEAPWIEVTGSPHLAS